ncbi:MAG: ABC transporter permease [Clostridiales bacterium]|nr:ABC transporter permease [Clostridiales bacterium]
MKVSVSHIGAIFVKQCKDVFKNTQVLVLFVIYPIVAAIMTTSVGGQLGQMDFFISIFATMHAVFTPVVVTASVISEEKEKNTLRVLIMSGVRPFEYLTGIGGFVFFCTMLTGSSYLAMGSFNMGTGAGFLLCMGIGCICSIVLGLAIGGFADNLMSANALAVPVSMVISFLPMIAYFNKAIGRVSKYIYGQQIGNYMQNPSGYNLTVEIISIVAVNFLLCLVAFIFVFRHNRIEN